MDYEMKFFADRGETPTSYLKKIGALTARLLAAHCIHLSEGDVELLREGGAGCRSLHRKQHKGGKGRRADCGVGKGGAFAMDSVRTGLPPATR